MRSYPDEREGLLIRRACPASKSICVTESAIGRATGPPKPIPPTDADQGHRTPDSGGRCSGPAAHAGQACHEPTHSRSDQRHNFASSFVVSRSRFGQCIRRSSRCRALHVQNDMRPAIDRCNVDGATRLHQDPVAPLAECRNQGMASGCARGSPPVTSTSSHP